MIVFLRSREVQACNDGFLKKVWQPTTKWQWLGLGLIASRTMKVQQVYTFAAIKSIGLAAGSALFLFACDGVSKQHSASFYLAIHVYPSQSQSTINSFPDCQPTNSFKSTLARTSSNMVDLCKSYTQIP